MRFEIDKVYNTDCVEGMKIIPDGVIDLVITDPPFGIDFQARQGSYNRQISRVMGGYSEIPKENYLNFTKAWMEQVYRVLKDSGSMYVFSGWNNLKDVLISLDDLGFITVNHIIWKFQFGLVVERRFITSHYHCLYVCKNDSKRKFFPYCRFSKEDRTTDGRSLHYRDKEDVWEIQREYWIGRIKTLTKLPAEIVRKILQYSSEEGDIVLDPFFGSGQVLVVAKEMRRHYIGFEIVKDYYDFAVRRLEAKSQSLI